MSDDADQYFNAWQGVFEGSDTCNVICVWHVHRIWRKAIKEHVVLKEDQVTIYYLLCTLITEREEAKFRTLLQEFLTYIFNNHERFHAYLMQTIVQGCIMLLKH